MGPHSHSGDDAPMIREPVSASLLTIPLQVCLEPLLLQIKFAFDLAQHLIVNAFPVAQSDNGSPLGCEHLLAKTELHR